MMFPSSKKICVKRRNACRDTPNLNPGVAFVNTFIGRILVIALMMRVQCEAENRATSTSCSR